MRSDHAGHFAFFSDDNLDGLYVSSAYTDAANAYRYFLRFRVLDLDADSTQILLKGPNLEVATRYKLPLDSRNGAKWGTMLGRRRRSMRGVPVPGFP